jgi:DNA-binding IscR family transcriptional regulator
LMAELEKAKLVRATAGRCGGFELERNADGITLADIYQAVEDETVFRMHKTDPNSKCPIACQMGKILGAPLRAAESALSTSLAGTTLKEVAEAVH